jgi:DNA-binding IclR family transcriptional regulator
VAQRVQAVERALALLEAVVGSSDPPTVAELAALARVNRATAWRLLNTLVHFGLVERDDHSGRYRIGPGAFRYAAAADLDGLARRSRSVLADVAESTGGSVYLEIGTGGVLTLVAEHRCSALVAVDVAGLRVPLHCGSVGKLYLATWAPAELDALLAEGLEACTERTITDPGTLRAAIAEAGRTGVATNYGEHRLEWCGITVAVRTAAGRDLAYLNVTLPTVTTSLPQLVLLTPTLQDAATRLADLLAAP